MPGLQSDWHDASTPTLSDEPKAVFKQCMGEAIDKTFGDVEPRIKGLTNDWKQWFAKASPQLKEFAPHHKACGHWLQSVEAGKKNRPFIAVWPRGHGKSTFAEHGVAYLAEREKRTFALYMCETQDAAERHLQNIQSLLERIGGAVGNRLENQYGHSKGWKKSMLRTASGFNAIALGFDVAMRGIKLEDFRPDLIIFDDVDGRHDSLHITNKKITTFTESILPAGSDDCVVWGVQNLIIPNGIFSRLAGVSQHEADFLAKRIVSGPVKAVEGLQTEQRYLEEYNRRAHIIVDGTPTWPACDLEDCQEDILEEGWTAFNREKQQQVKDVEGALWATELLNETRVQEAPPLTRTVVSVDPASTSKDSSDETGIIGSGRTAEGHGYVLADESGQYSPAQWGRKAVLLYDRIGADSIVAEKNQGGEMVEQVIKTAAKELFEEELRERADVSVQLVHASKGKRARAEPVAQKYEEHMIHHVGEHEGLEDQMTTWDASKGGESPDRVDGLVWGMAELLPLFENQLFWV